MYTVRQLLLTEPKKIRLSTSDEFGFLLTTRGIISVGDLWSLGADDLLICKPHRMVELEYAGGRIPLTAIWVRISTKRMRACSSDQTDILASFHVNPNPVIRVRSQTPLLMLIKNLALQLLSLPKEELRFGIDLMEQSSLQMFLALALKVCILEDPHRKKLGQKASNQLPLDDVFSYIHTHLAEDLSLERLEQEFFVSRHHLIREFKKRTGQTVHQYIVRARLELCRRYIEQGYSISDVYRMGGFGGYNHFFRAFKHIYGITPKEYYKMMQSEKTNKNHL